MASSSFPQENFGRRKGIQLIANWHPSIVSFWSARFIISDQIFIGKVSACWAMPLPMWHFRFLPSPPPSLCCLASVARPTLIFPWGAVIKNAPAIWLGTLSLFGNLWHWSGRDHAAVFAPAHGYLWCNRAGYALCHHLYKHHSFWFAVCHLFHRMQPFDSRRRQPHLFHGLYAIWSDCQYHPRPSLYLHI